MWKAISTGAWSRSIDILPHLLLDFQLKTSGVEALFVLGLIANIVQVVGFSTKVLGRIKDASSNPHELPKAFRGVAVTLPLLASALNKAQQQIGNLDEQSSKALRPVLKEYLSKIEGLSQTFENCLPKDSPSRLKRGCKAASSLEQDKKVEEISQTIWRHISLLTYHHAMSTCISTSHQLQPRSRK